MHPFIYLICKYRIVFGLNIELLLECNGGSLQYLDAHTIMCHYVAIACSTLIWNILNTFTFIIGLYVPRKKHTSLNLKEKDIICLPYNPSKAIPIPRKDKRAFLTKKGLVAKLSINHETTATEVDKIIKEKFSQFFEEPFQYIFLRYVKEEYL